MLFPVSLVESGRQTQLGAFLDPEVGSQNATVVVLVVVVVGISSLASEKLLGFLNTQRSATKLCIGLHIRADIAHRSTVSDFHLFSH